MIQTNYNERSWAIDLISKINAYCSIHPRTINRAGGERTLNITNNRLFPDVLLFGDETAGIILQGWELKFPDTPITDSELLRNAEEKARNLGTNSFIVWNVNTAILYILDQENNIFIASHSWTNLSDLLTRNDVERNTTRWVNQLHIILSDLNDLFETGNLITSNFKISLDNEKLLGTLFSNQPIVSANIRNSIRRNRRLREQINIWWEENKDDFYPENDCYLVLGKIVLLGWINKIFFAHYLKRYYRYASNIDAISINTDISEAKRILIEISNNCDFFNIFRETLADEYLGDFAWGLIKQLSLFFQELRLSEIEQTLLHTFLESNLLYSNRKFLGQFTTPISLANLMVRLGFDDIQESFFDPFCGTGTIARAAYNYKISHDIPRSLALSQVWASDKFDIPLQIATMSLSDPNTINDIQYLFKKDILNHNIGDPIIFIRPSDGTSHVVNFPTFPVIVSNFPFIRFETNSYANPRAEEINYFIEEKIGRDYVLNKRSDFYAYLPFYLWKFLDPEGRLIAIFSNSWLSTDWGDQFIKTLSMFYKINSITVSGNGRWFHNADVVTTIIDLTKRDEVLARTSIRESIKFCTLKRSVFELEDYRINDLVASYISQGIDNEAHVRIRELTQNQITSFSEKGLSYSAYFTDLEWFEHVRNQLISASTFFDINRGERRGWDKMFFPEANNSIEEEYLQPVLKSSREINSLVCSTDSLAFCCSKTIEELRALNHQGALDWINRFSYQVNEKGILLPEVLRRSNYHWYEMKTITMADMVISMNPDERLIVSRLNRRAFVNQRLIRFTLKEDYVNDIEILHALLNSILGIFYIEALGFGRGLGALDLSSSKLKKKLFILNPYNINERNAIEIVRLFNQFKERDTLSLLNEIDDVSRINFDLFVLESFGLHEYYTDIKSSLKELFTIRKSVNLRN
jgi:hypothetical protein